MATQEFIIAGENAIISLTPTIQNLTEAVSHELAYNGRTGLYEENYACWGTLAANAEVLANELLQLAKVIRNAKKRKEKNTRRA